MPKVKFPSSTALDSFIYEKHLRSQKFQVDRILKFRKERNRDAKLIRRGFGQEEINRRVRRAVRQCVRLYSILDYQVRSE